jgi:hypothetical protein
VIPGALEGRHIRSLAAHYGVCAFSVLFGSSSPKVSQSPNNSENNNPEHPNNMDKRVAPPVVTMDKMHNGLFIRFADGRSAFYSYDLLYATIETAQVVSPEMNNRNRSLEDE